MNRYRPRWPLLLVLVAGVGILIAVTYLPAQPSGEERPARGGRYVEGVAGAPSVVNPLFASFNEVDADLSSLVFAGLVRLGANGAVEPDLATLPRISPDGRTYVFELRDGLAWHDGAPLTSDDVVFTVRMVQDSDFQGDPFLVDLYREVQVEALNDRTVAMTLPEPFAPFLARGAVMGILPEHLLGRLDAGELAGAAFNDAPIGSGPFRLLELSVDHALLARFDRYHLGAPFLDEIELRFYQDDPSLLNALDDGAIDGALFRPGLDEEAIAAIDADEQLLRRSLHGTTYSLVYLNWKVPAFQDVVVRRALQFALDRDALVGTALAGQALPLEGPIVPGLWASVSHAESYASDPERAADLLDAAGWPLQGDVREQENAPFAFRLATSDDPLQVRVAQAIAQQWNDLGLDVQVVQSGASQFVEGVLLPREFHAALVTVDPGPDPDPYPFWHSTQALGEGRNLASYSNSTVDRLLENARQNTSVADRAASYADFQEIFAQEVPSVLLYTPAFQYVVRAGVRGLSPALLVTTSARFADAHRWYLETATDGDDDGN